MGSVRKLIMETIIFWGSVLFSVYWTVMWFRFRKFSVGHSAQFICAVMLWFVVFCFYLLPEISRFHMLWAMPIAFFASSFISAPYIRWRMAVLRKKHGLD